MEKVEIVFWLLFALGLSQMLGSSSKNEADVLLEFKKGINDTEGNLLDWNPGNVANMCAWAGISCDSSTSVVSIRLTSLLLQGSILPSIGQLTQLRELNLSRNYYMSGEIPSEITNCSLLEVLDLSYNLFQGRIPGFLGRLQRLRHLSLRWNYYNQEILSSLANCSSLEVIDLSRNQLGGRIPESLGQLSRLQNLSLADNSYMHGTLPRSLGNCSSLVGLRLRNNKFTGKIPVDLFKLPVLLTLGISMNEFTGIESGGYASSSIVELNLTSNSFNTSMDSILKGIQQMKHLQILALGGFPQQLSGEIPASLLSLKSLQSLDLQNNSYSSIPLDFAYGNLGYLDIRFNKFAALPSHASKFLKTVNVLRLARNQLTSIPPEIFGGDDCALEAIDMSRNNLSTGIPETLVDCLSLQSVDLSVNNLQGGLPSGMAKLRNLTSMTVFRNNLTGPLFPQVGSLEKLNTLDLSWNRFSGALWEDYSPGIGNLTKLTRLDLSNNHLSGVIPSELGRCSSITLLDLSRNELNGNLPKAMDNFTELLILNVGDNMLTGEVTMDFGATKHLVALQLGQNQFSGPLPYSLSNISLQMHQVQVSSQTRQHDFYLQPLCTGIQALDLRMNNFQGMFPEIVCKWTCLMVLSLANNNIRGTIPPCIANLTNLQVIDLSSNHLTGALPDQLDLMQGFKATNVSVKALGMISKSPEWYSFGGGVFGYGITLRGAYVTISNLIDSFTLMDFSNNELEGELPLTLSGLVGLMQLNISSNRFSGRIPVGLSRLKVLESLDLSHNNFEGGIPQEIAFMPELSSFSVAYNNLSGPIPTGNNLNTKIQL
ncbi:hypothetical protein SELMODRAFT_413431 [Selaginella moellendorffii]|uniref:Leucine-rich repeat-containing N-terminal plant-type domain-containing protein n=1 Tax=Selaginella moellendorffii TaxID=88036 RepID=D8RPF8_SELML|nr:hypothetical protein SELMODRAFT_413431 [Selaginella moellendorffii]